MKRRLASFAGAVVAVLLAGCGNATPITSGTPTPAPTITPFVSSEYSIPTASSQPSGIVAGINNLWFTETAADRIGMLNSSAVVSDFAVPSANAAPLMITQGIDRNLWFTESALPQIGRIGPTGTNQAEFNLGNPLARPWGIVSGPDGALWVTDPGTNGLWRVTTAGVPTFYPLATAGARPTAITVGPNGALWFVESAVDKIGTIAPGAPAGSTPTEYPVTPGAGLGAIVAGSDNALWFTETNADKIGRMLTSGSLSSETPLPGVTAPFGIALGADGNFYISDTTGSQIVQYIPSTGKVATFKTLTASASPYWVTLGPDNEIYFTEQAANKIGQFRYF